MDNTTPYVAYSASSTGGMASVKKFDGANWVNVGLPQFSTQTIEECHLVKDNDSLYVTARRPLYSYKATVWKYNGTSWAAYGNENFSAGVVTYMNIVHANGVTYVAYKDAANSDKTTVMKYIEPLVGIEDAIELSSFNIYPNPVKNQLTVNTEGQKINHIKMMDVTGKIIWIPNDITQNTTTINVADLPKGLYLLQIQTEKWTTTKRFIKE